MLFTSDLCEAFLFVEMPFSEKSSYPQIERLFAGLKKELLDSKVEVLSENLQLPHTDDSLLTSERGGFLFEGCSRILPQNYQTPAVNTMVVGRHLGLLNQIIGDRISQKNQFIQDAQYSTFCVGHSLGAHVCGFMGKTTNTYQIPSLTRIIAMDPAGKTLELSLFMCRVCKTNF